MTSRSRLDELAATAGAVRVPVPPLSRGAAVEVLRFALGTERVDADPEAAEELAELCERLPLALRIAGSRPAHRTVRSLVTAAADERYRLTALSLPDSGEGVRAALAASYHRLDPGTARLFRLLGEHPGDSVERSAAAALADTPLVETCARLEQLAAIHLLQETEHGRYRWSDLVRLYATEVAATETTAERDRAFSRLLDHYLHVTDRSLRFLGDCARWLAPPTEAPAVRTAQSALTWFRTEETTLHRCWSGRSRARSTRGPATWRCRWGASTTASATATPAPSCPGWAWASRASWATRGRRRRSPPSSPRTWRPERGQDAREATASATACPNARMPWAFGCSGAAADAGTTPS